MAQISEYSEAGITVRGTFYPSGKEAKDGDRKLYLAIESTSELAVSKAKAEITRLIKEELIKLVNLNFWKSQDILICKIKTFVINCFKLHLSANDLPPK